MSDYHQSVLLSEALAGLALKPNGIYIDATYGRGGHSQAILAQLGSDGRLLAIDKDPAAIAQAQQRHGSDPRYSIVHESFAHLIHVVTERDWLGKVNGILLDLGVSSPQLDDATRGFSFMREGPLDMRMDTTRGIDAATWLNQASAEEIARVLWEYGEERFSRRIARSLVAARATQPLQTTTQLARLINQAMPARERHKNPATRSFQGIRIFINNELDDLKRVLAQSLEVLAIGGRMSVISFHSLEDRIVKQFIQRQVKGEDLPPGLPIKACDLKQRMRKIDSLVRPQPTEIDANPRARSARLRIVEKIA